jgi:DNA-binding IclR family transcriptional regulator
METVDFEATWSALTLIQRSVLKVLALESTALPYSREFLERHRLTNGGTQRAVRVLLSLDLVEKDPDGRYRLTGPIMSAWLG